MPETAHNFADQIFDFFSKLSDDTVKYRACSYKRWKELGYNCVNFKRKYVVAFLDLKDEIIVCDFVPSKVQREAE